MRNYTIRTLGTLFSTRERTKIYQLLLLMLSVGALEVLGLASVAPFLGLVTDPDLVNKHSLIHYFYSSLEFGDPKTFIAFLGVGFLLVMTMTSTLNVILSWRINVFVQYTTARLSQELFQYYIYRPYSYHLDAHSSVFSKNILKEVARAVELVIYPILIACSKICVSIFIVALIVLVDPAIAVVSFFVFSIYYLLTFSIFKKRIEITGGELAETISERFKIISEAFAGVKEIKLAGKEDEWLESFKGPSRRFAELIASNQFRVTLPKLMIEILSYSIITTIIIHLSLNVPNSAKRVSLIALYGFSAYRLIPALHIAYESLMQAKLNFTALMNIYEEIRQSGMSKATKGSDEKFDFTQDVVVRGASYCYAGAENCAIQGIDIEFRAATNIGIVGESGSGKSTLMDALLGLLELSSGDIRLGTVFLRPENTSLWQKNIAYVPQEIFLFDGSIEQNIVFERGAEPVDQDRLEVAMQISGISELVSSLPEGLATPIGERGAKLSGGQKQRIGLARAVYKKAPVLILDEATSAIDSVGEASVLSSLQTLCEQPTVITVTHRVSTLKHCDVIHVMKNGRLISSGPFAHLIDNCQYFRELSQSS